MAAGAGAPPAHEELEAVCRAEGELSGWRLRCFRAEAEQRLLRQRQRGERHGRWPGSAEALAGLRVALEGLRAEAEELTAAARRPLAELAALRAEAAGAEAALRQREAESAAWGREEAAAAQLLAAAERRPREEQEAFGEREAQLRAERAAARRLAEELRAGREGLAELAARRGEAAAAARAARRESERLEMALEDERPLLGRLAAKCAAAGCEAERARLAVCRRSQAAGELEEELREASQAAEEEQLRLQQHLEECRAELSGMRAGAAEMGEQLRRARFGHGQQLQAVRQGGVALRGALSESGVEREELEEELATARAAVSALTEVRGVQLECERAASEARDAVDEEVNGSIHSLQCLSEEHQDTLGACVAAEAGLTATQAAWEATEEGCRHARASSGSALAALAELREELQELKGDLGAAASARRAERAAAQREELARLAAESEDLATQCLSLRATGLLRQGHREQQGLLRRAAAEAALKFKAGYAELLRELRAAKAKGGAELFAAVHRNSKRLGRLGEDFLRFLEGATAAALPGEARGAEGGGEGGTAAGGPRGLAGGPGEGPRAEVKLPEILLEAFAEGQEQGLPGGRRQLELLAAAKQRALELRAAARQAGAVHAASRAGLEAEARELRRELGTCEEELAACCLAGGGAAGDHGVPRLPPHKGGRRPRRPAPPPTAAAAEPPPEDAGTDGSEVSLRPQAVRRKEQEVLELRAQVSRAYGRYDDLVQQAGGRGAVEAAGLAPPPRPFWVGPGAPSPQCLMALAAMPVAAAPAPLLPLQLTRERISPRMAAPPATAATAATWDIAAMASYDGAVGDEEPPSSPGASAEALDAGAEGSDGGRRAEAATPAQSSPTSAASRGGPGRDGAASRGMSWADLETDWGSPSPTKLATALAMVRATEPPDALSSSRSRGGGERTPSPSRSRVSVEVEEPLPGAAVLAFPGAGMPPWPAWQEALDDSLLEEGSSCRGGGGDEGDEQEGTETPSIRTQVLDTLDLSLRTLQQAREERDLLGCSRGSAVTLLSPLPSRRSPTASSLSAAVQPHVGGAGTTAPPPQSPPRQAAARAPPEGRMAWAAVSQGQTPQAAPSPREAGPAGSSPSKVGPAPAAPAEPQLWASPPAVQVASQAQRQPQRQAQVQLPSRSQLQAAPRQQAPPARPSLLAGFTGAASPVPTSSLWPASQASPRSQAPASPVASRSGAQEGARSPVASGSRWPGPQVRTSSQLPLSPVGSRSAGQLPGTQSPPAVPSAPWLAAQAAPRSQAPLSPVGSRTGGPRQTGPQSPPQSPSGSPSMSHSRVFSASNLPIPSGAGAAPLAWSTIAGEAMSPQRQGIPCFALDMAASPRVAGAAGARPAAAAAYRAGGHVTRAVAPPSQGRGLH